MLGSTYLNGEDIYLLSIIHMGIVGLSNISFKRLVLYPSSAFCFGVIFVNLGNLSLLNQLNVSHHLAIYGYIKPEYIKSAASIWCISSTFFLLGYDFFNLFNLTNIEIIFNKEAFIKNLFYFLLIINISKLGGVALERKQVGKIITLLNTIGILFFARLWGNSEDKKYRMYALTLFLIQTYISLLFSYLRFELILPSFYLFIGYFIGKGQWKDLFSYRIFPFVFIFILYSSVFQILASNRLSFISAFTSNNSNNHEVVVREEKAKTGGLLDRSANVAQLTNIVNLVEKKGFYNGSVSILLLTALIPRQLWPEKPKIQLGTWFALEIGVGYKNKEGVVNNSINMTVPGELYLDFGWLGVVIGSFLFGGFFAAMWNTTRFYHSPYNLTGTIFGGYLIMLSIGSYADLQIVVTMLSTFLIFLIIKYIYSIYQINN